MKKTLSLLLALLLIFSVFSGCSEKEIADDTQQAVSPIKDFDFSMPTLAPPSINYPMDEPEESEVPETTDTGTGGTGTIGTVENGSTLTGSTGDLRYVLIYNPTIYDENDILSNTSYSTGVLGSQVETAQTRSENLAEESPYGTVAQDQLNAGIPTDEFDLSGNRGSGASAVYRVGDTRTFYGYTANSLEDPRVLYSFTCGYAGDYCYIWTSGTSLSADTISAMGTEFDQNIYNQVVSAFGTPRYADQGGKVHLLFYPMPSNLGGCFCLLDLYATGEATPQQIANYGINTDQALFHINADYAAVPEAHDFVRSTMAHEFQHLICGTNACATPNFTICRTWLNEAMSGYIEENLYPGAKEVAGHLQSFQDSYSISHGQSMYNFWTFQDDIGVYGSVYYFSEYMADLAGSDVFSNVHNFWRNCYDSGLDEAMALRNSVPDDVESAIDQSIIYPDDILFDTEDEEWMSKLILNFYLDMLHIDENDPEAFQKIVPQELLYDEINAGTIEGGGRVVIELTGNTFTVPEDADKGLLYVGLDENFEVITNFLY